MNMEPHTILSILSSRTRLEILKILSSGPKNLMEIKDALDASGVGIKYRESVYRALEKLVLAGLVDKLYVNGGRKVRYALAVEKVELETGTGRMTMVRRREPMK
jgi:Fe2+ or Zn2+ uptake regulation protein